MSDQAAAGALEDLAREFESWRGLLTSAAYRLLGSIADAEDVVQEVWLRWSRVESGTVEQPRAYLLKITTRLALNRLRQKRTRREEYVGPWLPEPLPSATAGSSSPAREGAEAVEIAESVSMAMLVVLQTLSPSERAAFVLHEVFGLPFNEVATTLGKTEPAVRQLAHRARSHVHARAPRHQVDAERHRQVTERFLQACLTGDAGALVAMMSPEVTLISDGGGQRRAALRPIVGSDKVLRWMVGVLNQPESRAIEAAYLDMVNGQDAIVARGAHGVDSVLFLTVEQEGITAIYALRNPDKLTRLSG